MFTKEHNDEHNLTSLLTQFSSWVFFFQVFFNVLIILNNLELCIVESTGTESNPFLLSVWIGMLSVYLIYINIDWYKLCCGWRDYND